MSDYNITYVDDWIRGTRPNCTGCGEPKTFEATGGQDIRLSCPNHRCEKHGEHDYIYPSGGVDIVFNHDGISYHYACPECGGTVGRRMYDDGAGYWDISLTCMSCGESTWE